jgi:hypothetical protein
MNFRSRLLAIATATSLAVTTTPSRADSPLLAFAGAVLAAEAAIISAELAAIATIVSAKMAADAQVKSAEISAKSETKASSDKDQSKRTAGASVTTSGDAGDATSFLPVGPLPKTLREFILQRGGKIGYSSYASDRGAGLVASAELDFQGDILSAPKAVKSFVHNEVVTYDVVVEDKSAKRDTTSVAFLLKELTLSTKDIKGSLGYSQITIRAVSGKSTTVWRARVDQGKMPTYDAVLAQKGAVKAQPDRLEFAKPAAIAIPVELGADKSGKVRITVTYEGSGKRT